MRRQLRRHGRFVLEFALPLVMLVSAAVVYVASLDKLGPSSFRLVPREEGESREAGLPLMAKSARAMPDSRIEGDRMGYPDDHLSRLAYPADDVRLEWLTEARNAFGELAQSSAAEANGTASWTSLGPESAVYQESQFRRFFYNPSRYVSSGRVTALAIAPRCTVNDCRLWVAAAGGGIWRTDKALSPSPKWDYLTANIPHNAIGAITLDPHDATGNTIWVGTGEPNSSADSAAGVGLLRSTDGGDTWSAPLGSASFAGRAISSIVINPVNPQIMYVGSTRGVRGIAATTGGTASLIPGAALWGLYKSTDGGTTWTYVHNGAAAVCTSPPIVPTPLGNLPLDSAIANGFTACSPRGVQDVALDPLNPNVVYAASGGRGIWRSTNAGTSWTRIKPTVFEEATGLPATLLNASFGTVFNIVLNDRAAFDVTTLPGNKTRIYVAQGAQGGAVIVGGTNTFQLYSRFSRTDDATAAAPVFTQLTSSDPANSGYGSYDICTGQCWYDVFVTTPAGRPNVVYIGGSYLYDELLANAPSAIRGISNGRGVLLSLDAGVSFNDQTEDSANKWSPNGLHPDQHALVLNPNNPFQFFIGSDGGVVRSDGDLEDSSDRCGDRGLSPVALTRCQQLLSNTPKQLDSLNVGLTTLQFQSLSVDPSNPKHVMGGTQDNGTFETTGSTSIWEQVFWGDGGQSGYDAADKTFRFHTFFAAQPEVNFTNGAVHDWNWIGDPLAGSTEPQAFYIPIISDPVESGWMFAGLSHVWRTKAHGRGNLSLQDFRDQCNRFKGSFEIVCGDWEPLAADSYTPPPPFFAPNNPSPASRLTGAKYGADRTGGTVSVVERATTDSTTLWAATSVGRVFISRNADAEPATAVAFTRLDSTAANDPNRFVSGIAIDPANSNHAWVAYTGFSAATPTLPGHIFEVLFNPATGTATWTARDFNLGDIPLTDVAFDHLTGTLYTSSDFGVMRLGAGGNTWGLAGAGLPQVEVSSLTIAVADRQLFAATHGLSAWLLELK